MCQLAFSDSFEYLCCGSKAVRSILFFQRGDRLYASESDVCKIQTYKDGLRAERVKIRAKLVCLVRYAPLVS